MDAATLLLAPAPAPTRKRRGMPVQAAGGQRVYLPYAGSTAWCVLRFFVDNAGEELESGDIALKFGAQARHIAKRLQPAVDAGYLTHTLRPPPSGKGRVGVYAAGPELPLVALAMAAHRTKAANPTNPGREAP